jgi:formiminotetrahydrofolate cyclodeaminase
MKLTERTVVDLLAAFRSSAPVPGGGSASALAGAAGAALLAMVGSMPKHRAATEEDVERLRDAARRSNELSERLTELIDLDAEAYESVVAAYRLPKRSVEETADRSGQIQRAVRGAIDVPLETMRRSAEAIEAAAVVAAFGNSNAASDVGVALELLRAGARGARLNVEINLPSVKESDYVQSVRGQTAAIDLECERGLDAARARLQG